MILKNGEEELVAKLLEENEEFRKLYDEHQDLENKLEEFKKLRHLIPDDEVQVNTLKKLKLQGKDRMAQIIQISDNQ
jgi:uncharacterized protein YdcH (DUF465 family)